MTFIMSSRAPAFCLGHLFAVLLILPLMLGVSCQRKKESGGAPAAKGPTKVYRGMVTSMEFADEVEALGTVRADEAIELSANVTERVKAVHFEDGQVVKMGELLVELSNEEELAMLEGGKVNLAEQEREIERLSELAEDGAVSKVRLQAYYSARDLAQQKIEEIKARLEDRRIVAPFDGILGFRQVSVGALVSPGEVIATLDLIDTVRLDFSIPETFLGDLSAGQAITAHSEAYPGKAFEGAVREIDVRVDPVTRSAVVRAELPNAEHRLQPGMLLTTTVKKNPGTSLAVPERSVLSVQSRHFVFALEGEEGAGTVRRVSVLLGRRVPGYVEITGGLKEGQEIVTDGLIGLREGAPVEIIGEFSGPSAPYSPTEEPKEETPATAS